MANSEIPPVKDRLEMMTATQKDDTGLTRGLLHVLNRQVRALSCIILSLPDTRRSHARTVVRECCKGDDESQWERVKFDPPPPKNPLTDGHQNLRT